MFLRNYMNNINKKIIVCQLTVIVLTFCFANPAALAENPQLRILKSASELDYPPFALVQPDGSADGFSVDLLKNVVRKVGLKIDIPVAPWHEIKQKLIDGKLDVLPLVSYSSERDEIFDFTVPYLRMHGEIFVRKGEKTIQSIKDLKDKEVLVMRGDTAHEYAVKANLSDKLILTESFTEAMNLLSEGKHDAVVVQQLVGLQLINKLGILNVVSLSSFRETSLRPKGGVLAGLEQKFCFAVKEGDTELLALLNEGLSIVVADGTYDNLYNKWFGPILPPRPVSWREMVKFLLTIFLPIMLLLAFGGVWYLNREVRRKTQNLNDEKIKAQRYLDITASIIVVFDDKGNITLLNKKGCEFFGCEPNEIMGKDWFTSFIPENGKVMAKEIFEKLISGNGSSLEYYENFVLAEGNIERIVAWSNNLIRDDAGNIVGVISSGNDITESREAKEALQKARNGLEVRVKNRTVKLNAVNERLLFEIAERKQAESLLIQAQKMEAVGTLAGGVAHDFNNMLGGILNFAEIIKNKSMERHLVEEYADDVLKLCKRGRDVVRQLLTFVSKGPSELEPFVINVIINESLKVLSSSFPSIIDIQAGITPNMYTIMGDQTQIEQLLLNLGNNAAHAMGERGGVLEIKLDCITVNQEMIQKHPGLKSGSYVKLIVSDTGIGIAPEDVDKIFNPFFTTKKVGEGTGLGLSVVHGIVENHGGVIVVDSELDRGTTFTVFFPIIEAMEEEKYTEDIPVGTERILFVDDEWSMIKTMGMLLEDLGYKVTAMMNSTEALEIFKKAPDSFDIVITDLTMPEMTGDSLTKELIKIRSDIPVILCTGFGDSIDVEKIKAYGIREILSKPYESDALAKTIREIFDNHELSNNVVVFTG
jgi:PAS domain S-box-containing protein